MRRKNDSRSRGEGRGSGPPGPGGRPTIHRSNQSPTKKLVAGKLRIIGGDLGGRTLRYHGAAYTRPMKDSVRENLFNILGTAVRGTTCFDLYSGTGALSFEALSRGADSAVAVECSRHAVRFLRESARQLGVEHRMRILTGDAHRLAGRLLASPADDRPWLVFLCPPYRMWEDEEDFGELKSMIRLAVAHAPARQLRGCGGS